MTKDDIILLIKDKMILERKYKKRSITSKIILSILDAFFSVIKENILKGEHIELRGFGSFEAKIRESKKARNPRTNKEVIVKRHAIPVFKPGRDFKNTVRNSYQKL